MKRMIVIACVAFALLVQCGSSSPGTVPPDLRDLERDGEGLVSTTFGAYPARTPDWTRAAGVLSLLEQVWGRAKTANPSLPKEAVAQVDAAVSTLHTAITNQDQKSAAYAANSIGLAVPPLFDYFHPDAPIEVVRMDAMFRQIGLDAHFQNSSAVAADLASLDTDWAATRSPVAARVPTCHRVGGTATVSSDIDQSLSNVHANASDFTTIEVESENGALEIDTLELLFDCPPDNVAPTKGLGAKCASNASCDPGQVCDLQNAGGKCAPDSSNKIGTPCTSTIDCGTDARAACQTASGDNYPGGYCFMEPCNDIEVCPPGATCVSLGGETPGCFKACAVDADCRASEGYVCQLFVTTPPVGFGPSDHACAFACTRDADCQAPLTCDVATGKCKP